MGVTTIFRAAKFFTMEQTQPEVTAVAVRDGRIVGMGTLDQVTQALAAGSYVVDDRLEGAFVTPGLIDQHVHPILGATTLTTEVIAPERWDMPGRVFAAASSPEEYLALLSTANEAMDDPDEWLFTWGYHALWHGPMSRTAR